MRKLSELLESFNIPAIVALMLGATAVVAALIVGDKTTVAVVFALVAIASAQLA